MAWGCEMNGPELPLGLVFVERENASSAPIRAYTEYQVVAYSNQCRKDERLRCADELDAMWHEFESAATAYRTESQEGWLDALAEAEKRLRLGVAKWAP